MPSSTACSRPSARARSANSRSSPACSIIFSLIVSQPRRLPISGTPGPPQSDSSFCHIRCATRSACARFTRSTSGGSRSSGMDEWMVGGRPVTIPSRVDSMLSTSESYGTMNLSIPSRRRVSVTSDMSIPASARAWSSAVGSSWAVPGVTSSCSAHACSVGMGIVLTVSLPTRVSTYFVSGYCGSLTPVDAHSGRCTGQPASRRAAKRSPRKTSSKRP